MGSKLLDMVGSKFHRLTVIAESPKREGSHERRWACRCECGNTTIVYQSSLRDRNTKSCGCLAREKAKKQQTTHGKTGHYLHYAWEALKQRCLNPNNPKYESYGARGITIHEPWAKDFQLFYDYIMSALGERPTGFGERRSTWSLDRIDNNKGYEPGNLRWATMREQALNTRKRKPKRPSVSSN